VRNKILELKFAGKYGTATIVLTNKLQDIPEGMANLFPLTVRFFRVQEPDRPCHYYCRDRAHAKIVADALVDGSLHG